MMKNKAHAPIKGLLFRELYMGRNTYISITAIFFGIMLLCVLVLLSLDFGNLSKLPADVIDSARSTIRSVSIYVPAAIFFMNTSVVVDTAAEDYSPYARRLRLVLAAEHLDRGLEGPEYPGEVSAEPDRLPDDDELLDLMADCLDAEGTFRAFAESAAAREEWHRGGRRGERPRGRLRPLQPPRLNPLLMALAAPAYLWLHDPDGRPWRLRLRRRY